MRPDDVRLCARAFLDRFGLDCVRHADDFASDIGLKIKEVDAEIFDGALLRVAQYSCGTVLINRSIPEPGRKLFTLAHEMGHYVLPGHGAEASYCRRSVIESWHRRLSKREKQANVFAAEILMPFQRIQNIVAEEPTFAAVEEIGRRCGSSLTASAYRLAELTSHRFAIVWSENGRVCWYRESEDFDFKVRVEALSSGTFAADCFADEVVPDEFNPVSATSWLYPKNLREDATLLEHSRHLPNYEAVLTLLLIPEVIELNSKFGDEYD